MRGEGTPSSPLAAQGLAGSVELGSDGVVGAVEPVAAALHCPERRVDLEVGGIGFQAKRAERLLAGHGRPLRLGLGDAGAATIFRNLPLLLRSGLLRGAGLALRAAAALQNLADGSREIAL